MAILLPGYLWKLPVRGDRWAGQPGQHWQCSQTGRTLSPFSHRLSLLEKRDPSRTTRPQGMFLLLFIHSVLKPSSPHFVSLAGKGSPCSWPESPFLPSLCGWGISLCWCDFPEAVLWEHSYQINLPEIHLTPSCEPKVALPKHHTSPRGEQGARSKWQILFVHPQDLLKSLIVLVCNLWRNARPGKAACNL